MTSCNHLLPCEWRLSFPFVLWSSEDDAFLLYATLRSGKHCKFVTRDFLRDHKACLPDSLTRHLFRKWQRGHQIAFSPSAEGRSIKFLVSFPTAVRKHTEHIHWRYIISNSGCQNIMLKSKKWICTNALKTPMLTENSLDPQSMPQTRKLSESQEMLPKCLKCKYK